MVLEGTAWAQAAGAVLEVALACWVYAVAPRSNVNRAFALFLFAVGVADLFGAFRASAAEGSVTESALWDAAGAGYMFAAAGLVWLAVAYPGDRPLSGKERAVLAGFVAITIATVALTAIGPETAFWLGVGAIVSSALIAAQGAAASWLSRHLGHGDLRRQESTRLVVLGLALWPANTILLILSWIVFDTMPDGAWLPVSIVNVALCALVAPAVWRLARRGADGRRRWGQTALLATVAALAVPASFDEGLAVGSYTITIIGMVALVAYGILRYDLFTLDGKVRFAISRSTIAAAFVAVFFLASEATQQVFDARFGSAYGIAAAGMLVFALAPLQRAAERVAATAVPVPQGSDGALGLSSPRAEEAYRAVLRRFLRDGILTRDEERTLATVAGELRIDAGRAFELRDEIESESVRQ